MADIAREAAALRLRPLYGHEPRRESGKARPAGIRPETRPAPISGSRFLSRKRGAIWRPTDRIAMSISPGSLTRRESPEHRVMARLYCPSCDYPPESEQDLALHLADEHGLSQLQAESRARHVASETSRGEGKPKEAPMAQGVKGTATKCGYCKRPLSQPHSNGCRIAKAQDLPREPLTGGKARKPSTATTVIAAPPRARREAPPARTAAANGQPPDALTIKLAELRAQIRVLEELKAAMGSE